MMNTLRQKREMVMGGLHQIKDSRQVAANSKSGTEGANTFLNGQNAAERGKKCGNKYEISPTITYFSRCAAKNTRYFHIMIPILSNSCFNLKLLHYLFQILPLTFLSSFKDFVAVKLF